MSDYMNTVNSIIVKETPFPREWKVIEELSELIVALTQSFTKDNPVSRQEILEEYVDSLIVLDQLRIKYKFTEEEIKEIQSKKLDKIMDYVVRKNDEKYGKNLPYIPRVKKPLDINDPLSNDF